MVKTSGHKRSSKRAQSASALQQKNRQQHFSNLRPWKTGAREPGKLNWRPAIHSQEGAAQPLQPPPHVLSKFTPPDRRVLSLSSFCFDFRLWLDFWGYLTWISSICNPLWSNIAGSASKASSWSRRKCRLPWDGWQTGLSSDGRREQCAELPEWWESNGLQTAEMAVAVSRRGNTRDQPTSLIYAGQIGSSNQRGRISPSPLRFDPR